MSLTFIMGQNGRMCSGCKTVFRTHGRVYYTMPAASTRLAGPRSRKSQWIDLSNGSRIDLVQNDPDYPDLALFDDGRFGMRLFVDGRRQIISSIHAWELERLSDGDTIFKVALSGIRNQLGVDGEHSNVVIFNTEPLQPTKLSADGSSRAIADVIERLGSGFSTALAQGRITRDSMLVLKCVLQGGNNGWFAEAYSYATSSNVAFCCATAFALSDGSGLWEFKVFGFEVALKAEG